MNKTVAAHVLTTAPKLRRQSFRLPGCRGQPDVIRARWSSCGSRSSRLPPNETDRRVRTHLRWRRGRGEPGDPSNRCHEPGQYRKLRRARGRRRQYPGDLGSWLRQHRADSQSVEHSQHAGAVRLRHTHPFRVRCVLCVRTKPRISRWRCQLRLAYDRWCADRKSADFRRRPHGQHDSLSKCVRDNHFGQADIFRVPSTVGPGADPAQPNYDRCGRYLSQPCASIRQDHIRQHHAWRNLGKPVPAASRVKPDGICASSMRATANRKPAFGGGVPSRLCPNQVNGAAFASRNGVLLSARSRSSRDGAQRSPYC